MIKKDIAQRLAEIRAKGTVYREATVGLVDTEARTAELSFSSEAEYERWWGIEVLSHDPEHADFSRLNDGGALLWNHNWDDQRGVVQPGTAHIGTDKKGRAVVRFSKSAAGEELMQDVADKIKTKVSVGYMVNGIKLLEERENIDVYLVTSWQALEISIVSVPADTTVGVGRALENPPEETPPKQAETAPSIDISAATRANTEERKHMKQHYYRDAQGNLCRVAQDENGNAVGEVTIVEKAGDSLQAGTKAERARTDGILALADSYSGTLPQAREMATQFIKDGKTGEEFQRALLDAFNKRTAAPLSEQSSIIHVGMSDNEVRRYSFMNVVRALANPQDVNAQKAAAFEIEASLAAQKALGRSAKGIMIPPDVLSRAMSATGLGGNTTGASLVDTEVLKGSFIDLLRNRCIAMQLATVLGGLVGNVDVPKKTGDGQAYWLGEDEDTQETGFTLGQISFSPKTVGAFTEITRRLLQQSSQSVEGMVRGDLINALAVAIDKAYWYGPGTEHQPRGLRYQNGINAVDFAAANQPTYGELVDMETEVAADNADVGSMAYVGNARFRGHCKKTLQFPGVASDRIWEKGNTVNGYRTEITNQVAQGDVFFGNYADSIIALWGGLDLIVDPYSNSKKGGLRIVAFKDVDMGLRRAESICWGSAAAA